MSVYFLPKTNQGIWLSRLAEGYNLFTPVLVDGKVHWSRYEGADTERLALEKIRAAESIKGFFFSPREKVASFPGMFEPETLTKRTVLFGVKGCDLRGIAVHKRMFLEGEFADPFFAQRLNNTILLGADCPAPERTCFCNLLGLKPFVTEEADLSLTVLDDGWLIEALSERGAELMGMEQGFQKATDGQIAKREEQRQKAMQILKEQNPKEWNPNLSKVIADKTPAKKFWIDAARDCVECFGCLLTCPTCFCFLLYDQGNAAGFERNKVWDFCYIPMYARVGGGANPRARFIDRFINRFHCKFMHSKNQNGFYACSGCGRCFSTCMGRIDIRNILGQL